MEFCISVLLRPEIERDGREFVDQRDREAVLGEVDRLDVGLAGVAALDTDVGELCGGIDRKLGVVFLTASGADDAAELPFGEAETAEQAAAGAVALLAEDTKRRFAIAKGTQWMRALKLKRSAGADEFSVRLQEREREEFVRIRRHLAGGGPAGVQQIRPGTRGCVAQIVCDLGKPGRAIFFHHGQKWREADEEFRQFQWSGQGDWRGASRSPFDALVEAVLKLRGMDVEGENLRGEGMLSGEVLSAPDPLLPGSVGHRAIMGLGFTAGNCGVSRDFAMPHRIPGRIPGIDWGTWGDYSSWKFGVQSSRFDRSSRRTR